MPQPRINLPHFRAVTAGLAVTNAKLCIQWSQTRAACSLYSACDALCWVFDSCGIAEKTSPLVIGKGTEFLHHVPGDGCRDLRTGCGAVDGFSLSLSFRMCRSSLLFFVFLAHLSLLPSWIPLSTPCSTLLPLSLHLHGPSPKFSPKTLPHPVPV